jgi:hypothetical protein
MLSALAFHQALYRLASVSQSPRLQKNKGD